MQEERRQMIRTRLEQLLDLWLTATPAMRNHLLMERLRLEWELEELERAGTVGT